MSIKLVVLVAALAAPTLAHANDMCSFAGLDASKNPIYDVRKVEYFSAPADFSTTAWRCDWNTGRCSLSGYIISKANAPGNQPAIIFEHGSAGETAAYDVVPDQQNLPEYSCAIRQFVDDGYVVFYPLRRGVIDVTPASFVPPHTPVGWTNSGWAAQDWAVMSVQSAGVDENVDNYVGQYIRYLQMEVDDLVPGITTLIRFTRPDMTKRLVDPTRIALVGHSLGGAFVTFAATDDDLYTKFANGPRGFVSLSGAAMSYHGSHWWHDVLTSSTAINNAPLYFTRTLDEDAHTPNDFASAQEPFATIGNFVAASGMWLFSGVGATCANDTVWHCNHAAFVQNQTQIARWHPKVAGFLQRVGM